VTDEPDRLLPYRVEWRKFPMDEWSRAGDEDTHDAAVALLDWSVAEWGGEARMVVQHVTERRKA
jgi:hypothetical protein